jgi:general secretion pathway protein G
VIVGILAALAIINTANAIEKSRVTTTIAQIRNLEIEIGAIEIDRGVPPPSLAAIGKGHLKDPWGAPFQYLSFATVGKGIPGKARKDKKLKPLNSTYDLYSMGPDGDSKSPLSAKASHDDIIRAADGAFIGRASDF